MPELHPKFSSLPGGCAFHHIGYATASRVEEQGVLALLGYQKDGEDFADLVQGVSGCFLNGPGPRIELLENLPGSNTLTPWLAAGIKMYHLAYLVADLEGALDWARGQRAKVTVQPVPAVAFGGCRIGFVMFRNGLLIEFIEEKHLVEIGR